MRLRREMDRIPKRIPVATMAELTPAPLVAYFEYRQASRKAMNQTVRSDGVRP